MVFIKSLEFTGSKSGPIAAKLSPWMERHLREAFFPAFLPLPPRLATETQRKLTRS